MNLHDLFSIPLRRTPGKLALSFSSPDGPGVELTYGALFAAAERLAAGLAARGVERGERVAVFLGNRPELVIAYLALLRLGAATVALNPAYRRRELEHLLADAAPRLLLTEAARLPVLEEVPAEARAGIEVVLAEDLDRLGADQVDPAGTPPPPPVSGDDLALLLYTSGTTGPSKGAMITHDNVLATVAGLLAAWAWEPADVLLLSLPLFHVHGLVVGLTAALAAGATVLLHSRFDAAEVARALTAGEATLFFGVPTMYVRLVEELRRSAERSTALDRLRLCCSGSAPLSPETFAAFRELAGHTILERYGMTEAGMILSNPYAGPRLPGTVGTPLPGVSIRIVDAEGRDVPEGSPESGEGELLVRGGNVFAGYFRAPEKTAASFVHDAEGRQWFRTGDLARRDPATGHVALLGRRHELILCGGYNVYPREVEEALLAVPGIREAAVAGRPDPELGEVPVAYLVADGPLDEPALLAHLETQLARFKLPREIRYLDALPRNALGKVEKHRLG
jgi:malonyl-CoA/methylmalonyl-CoA synthetase